MIYEFAISPILFTEWQDLRFFLQTFGREEGRLLSDIPRKKWINMTRKEINASDNGQVMKKRLKAGIERLERKAIYRRNAVPEVESELWIDHALEAHRCRPLQAILTDNYDGDHESIIINDRDFTDDIRWKIPLDATVARSANIMVQTIQPMLDCAREIILIDRNFDPDKYRWRLFLLELASILSQRPFSPSINKIGFHVGDDIAANHLELLCRNHIENNVPDNMQIIFFVWPRDELHDRYVLTDIGGVRFGIGLDIYDGQGPEEVEISRISEGTFGKWWSLCKTRTAAFSIP